MYCKTFLEQYWKQYCHGDSIVKNNDCLLTKKNAKQETLSFSGAEVINRDHILHVETDELTSNKLDAKVNY